MTAAGGRTAGSGPAAGSETDWIRGYGLISDRFGGIQVDTSLVARWDGGATVQTYLCDHNCTTHARGRATGGKYNCPAALTLNRGGIALRAPGADRFLEGMRRSALALEAERDRYLVEDFPGHCEAFGIPGWLADAARQMWVGPGTEITLFGGSPEAHPEVIEMVTGLVSAGHSVHITMTGRRLMREPGFAARLVGAGPAVVALSGDDLDSPADLERLLELDLPRLKAEWRDIPRLHGQRQKVYEGIYACRALAESGPRLLLNVAIHAGNIGWIDRLLDAWAGALPQVWLNPFPAQDAFDPTADSAGRTDPGALEAFCDRVIALHHDRVRGMPPRWPLVPRLHYWLMLRAAFRAFRQEPDELRATIAGRGFWRCYASPGAGRYLQVAGGTREPVIGPDVGGRPGCFWNPAITAPRGIRVWDADVASLHSYMLARPALARAAPQPCHGCGFPRLVGDSICAESGMTEPLRTHYLQIRHHELGY
jgi:hypothetical protein